jgi:hypothetical protein
MLPFRLNLKRQPIVGVRSFNDLLKCRKRIVDAAAGIVPEALIVSTVDAVVRLARNEVAPTEVLPERTVWLVRESLLALAQRKWKPDTVLKLVKRPRGGGHGLAP